MWLSPSRTTLSASASEEGYLRVRYEPRREGVRLEGAIQVPYKCHTLSDGCTRRKKKKGRNSIKCFFNFLSTIGAQRGLSGGRAGVRSVRRYHMVGRQDRLTAR